MAVSGTGMTYTRSWRGVFSEQFWKFPTCQNQIVSGSRCRRNIGGSQKRREAGAGLYWYQSAVP